MTFYFLTNSDNHGQKSWDKFTFVALFHTRRRVTPELSTLVQPLPPPPTPPTMFDTCTQSFNIVLAGGGGGEATHFEADNRTFLKLLFKTQKINAITQVSQGILSTIVGTSFALLLLWKKFLSQLFTTFKSGQLARKS